MSVASSAATANRAVVRIQRDTGAVTDMLKRRELQIASLERDLAVHSAEWGPEAERTTKLLAQSRKQVALTRPLALM